MNKLIPILIVIPLIALILLSGCLTENPDNPDTNSSDNYIADIPVSSITSFKQAEGDACTVDGKPVIRLYSTTWCPHCKLVKKPFDDTVNYYVDQGLIVAYHFELDTGDDTLTSEVESEVPAVEQALFKQFNAKGSIPTFVFGCKYYRIGNGFESNGALDEQAEIAEFKAVIEKLIAEAK
ncbi:MAG: hypothetical protein ABH821_01840 [archaeon]